MAKDKSLSKDERRAAKKAAKESSGLLESAGVSKSSSSSKDKADKKEKKEKKAKLAERLLKEQQKEAGSSSNVGGDGEVVSEDSDADGMDVEKTPKGGVRPVGALVPFANPLADEKVAKKVFRGVKKAAATRTLKRGVKEVVKSLRKSQGSANDTSNPVGIVVLAADISPMDVISHIPVLCEDHGIPYVYVTSRAELGMAGQTKRPTSVVMISREIGGKAKKEDVDVDEWKETYKGLVKVVEKEGRHVKV